MRRIFQNLLASVLGGIMWVGFIYIQLKQYNPTWQVLAYAFGFGFLLVAISTFVISLFVKEDKKPKANPELEVLKADE